MKIMEQIADCGHILPTVSFICWHFIEFSYINFWYMYFLYIPNWIAISMSKRIWVLVYKAFIIF